VATETRLPRWRSRLVVSVVTAAVGLLGSCWYIWHVSGELPPWWLPLLVVLLFGTSTYRDALFGHEGRDKLF
jgi:hypothetical protein